MVSSTRDFSSLMIMRARSSTNFQQNKIRVLVIGASGVGKTSIIEAFTQKKFVEGFDDASLEEAGTIIVELMDLNVSLLTYSRRLAVRTAQAYMLVYSVQDPLSFDYITDMKREIAEMKGEGMPIVVVGNKADMPDHIIQHRSKTAVVATDWDIPFTSMSVRTGVNIESVYRHLFGHRTLQKLIEVVAVINASTISLITRRMSLPGNAFQSRLPTDLSSVTRALVEEKSPETTRENTHHVKSQEQSNPKSKWSKLKKHFAGWKVRK